MPSIRQPDADHLPAQWPQGDGGQWSSSALAQLFISELVNCYETPRPSLPGLALTPDMATISAIATGSRFPKGLCQTDTCSWDNQATSWWSSPRQATAAASSKAAEAALSRDMTIIVLGGGGRGEIAGLLGPK